VSGPLVNPKQDAKDVLARTETAHWKGQWAPHRGTEYIEGPWLRRDFQRKAYAAQWRALQVRRRARRSAS
jgi:hypothetical protein